ncbi:hypothetical protein CERZMDRAFT_42044 [Cercospora zeae-maydis SCOH1-5]|uniref:Histidine kinase n=1 Tax=Cercospora zeae-maydis SCOH1-5 TaxID=717836 RepID=A0A6A6FF64_9PEZI|nr:hypothetical protein CERZMDRAFT_42044 [Cercospora zeae-maydis SCOH1-5]
MTSHAGATTGSPRRKMLYESRRAREFYRYYQPIRELTKAGPPTCDIGDESAVRLHRPLSCPDRALTAFCQLGALRMATKRAMLFFFDSTSAYVLAESTRTLSLQDDSKHAAEDDLWLGHSIIPRGYSVCEQTIMLPSNEGSNKSDSNASMIHIVNDLVEDTRYCDRPFVVGGPKAKFYAGVPITTPKGINIGAYCVLDDQPRPGLDEDSVNFMRDMATTVMTHLEMVRATAEHKIGTKMVAGLGAFIDGASGFRDWAERNADWNMEDVDANLAVPSPNTSARGRHRAFSSVGGLPPPTSAPPHSLKYRRSTEKLEDPEVSRKQSTFGRAAKLIREAMDVEGVMFLDAAVGTFGGLIETVESGHNSTTHTDHTEMSSDNHQSAAEANTTGTDTEAKAIKKTTGEDLAQKQCQVLASSCAISLATMTDANCTREATEAQIKCHEQITEKFLRSLLRRYPRGKIWSFNEHGDASSDDDESSEYNSDAKSCRCLMGKAAEGKQTHAPSCSKRRKHGRRDDCAEILRLFPGVRSFGLVGMWDNTRQRWYAASLFWSHSPLRLFSEESEVKYMTAFCDVILAEIHRIEAQTSDRAKSDFISTISHELRSPLHGILGSVECLQETDFDSFSTNLISQVEICGRTLLDIIDHLLDFSKINHHAKSRAPRTHDRQGRKLSSNSSKRTRMGGLMALDVDVALDQITEEVVETAVYSFCCSRDADTILRRKVAVILDIDRTPDIDWRCSVAVGAWKRICINLVSNSLKYTQNGHIRVSLRANPLPDKNQKKRFNVTFSVQDTGKGMSKDFLENHLFRAFAQEDSLVEGTGLGMNLVAKIVKSFEGKIEVLSEKGVGSCFSVTLPLELSRTKRESGARNPARPLHRSVSGMARAVAGCSVGIIDSANTPSGNQRADETARALLLSGVHKTLGDIGIEAFNCTWQGDEAADLYLVSEAELSNEQHRRQEVGCLDGPMSPSAVSNKPFIVLCDSTVSARRMRAPGLGNIATGHIELIAQPAGPERLVKAISACLRNKREVARDMALAGAVSDVPAMVPHPDASDSTQRPGLVYRGRNDTITSRSQQAKQSSSSASKKNKKSENSVSMLLVDDNSINLQLLVTYAEKNGHRKAVATDGQQATSESVPKGEAPIKPQVVLMDINMPVLNGFEATRAIRGFEKQKGLEAATIIALTGLGSASAQQEAFSSGVDLFLTKPVRLKELTNILNGIKR